MNNLFSKKKVIRNNYALTYHGDKTKHFLVFLQALTQVRLLGLF